MHPETGEVLESLEDFRHALAEVDARLGVLYRERRKVSVGMAERFDAELPRRRWRSETQEKVARCPRCGERIEAHEV